MRHLFPPRVEHLHALFLPCLISYFQRHMACLASLLVSCPVLGQRQAEVKQGMVVARDVAHEDPTWQLSTLPRWPHHWRFTPTECVPRLGKLLGSKAMMPSGSPNRAATCPTNTVTKGR